MSALSSVRFLHQLARLYGVQTAYYDVSHHRQGASIEALLSVLQSLGAPVATLQDVPSAWRERRQAQWQRMLEPVAVAWDGGPPIIHIRLPSATAEANLIGHLTLETGEQRSWKWCGVDLPVLRSEDMEGTRYVVKQLSLPVRLPWGYHQLSLELLGKREESLIISSPFKAYVPSGELENRTWGVFLPLYALRTERSWGSGDFSDLEALITWVATMGGQMVATLPLLATFFNEVFESSPYLPVSRLLWNEFYLDISRVPELRQCASAQALLESLPFREETGTLHHSPLVDYRHEMALKRRVLEELCRCLFTKTPDRLSALHCFAKANPVVEDYARFRATSERQGTSWRSWPAPLREGILQEGDYDEESKRYHLYVQWLAHQQIQNLSEKARENGSQLYLDLPLGVHPDGYDVWRERAAFALDASVGAPPDAVFTKGQSWGFPPLHPERIREQGYRYVTAYLCHHFRHAGILRIDHVMSLHRLFWIPKGLEPSQGLYVRYPADEFYAILALESHRNKAIIVGEDLGTVPPQVRPAMRQHGLHCMYVVQYELASNKTKALKPVSTNCVASLNTHDMPPFAAFWQGLDIKERLKLGLLNKAGAVQETEIRHAIKEGLWTFLQRQGWITGSTMDDRALLNACLASLSASRARVVLVNLEDLWLETQPQNVPGTEAEYPNWQRKARYSLEAFCQMPEVLDTLRMVDCLRKQSR